MNALLSPAPALRANTTLVLDEASPEALVGRFEGKTQNTTATPVVPQNEQPWWALAVKCLALRMTYEETGSFCEVSSQSIKNALRAPLFQIRLREALNTTTTPLTALFADAGVKAFHKIIEVMEDSKTPKAVILASAKEIIDRCLGKAPLTIKHEDNESVGDPVALVEQLKAQNVELRKQLPN